MLTLLYCINLRSRYQKCLQQGMLKEGVRLDRVRGGRQKYRRYSVEAGHTALQTPSRKVSLEENTILTSLSLCEPEQQSPIR